MVPQVAVPGGQLVASRQDLVRLLVLVRALGLVVEVQLVELLRLQVLEPVEDLVREPGGWRPRLQRRSRRRSLIRTQWRRGRWAEISTGVEVSSPEMAVPRARRTRRQAWPRR